MALFSLYPYHSPGDSPILHADLSLKVNSVKNEENKNILEKFYG
jgi:hypothetical protein